MAPTSGSARTALMCWQIFTRVGSNSWRWWSWPWWWWWWWWCWWWPRSAQTAGGVSDQEEVEMEEDLGFHSKEKQGRLWLWLLVSTCFMRGISILNIPSLLQRSSLQCKTGHFDFHNCVSKALMSFEKLKGRLENCRDRRCKDFALFVQF